MMVHPTFDLTYENHGYVDRSASRNSHEISRDWSSSAGSTLDIKRSLEHVVKDMPYNNGGPYRNIPSPQSHNSRDCTSSCSSSRAPPLETAMQSGMKQKAVLLHMTLLQVFHISLSRVLYSRVEEHCSKLLTKCYIDGYLPLIFSREGRKKKT